MIIEGKNSVLEAIENNMTINKLLVQKNLMDSTSNNIIKAAKAKHIRIDFVDKEILDKKCQQKKHQGFLAEMVDYEYSSVEEILQTCEQKSRSPFLLLLDGIEDPHNFGAIIRSAECAGVDGIIIPERRACAVTDTVVKTSAGAIAYMKIAKVTNLNQTIDMLKKKNIWVYALETGGKAIKSVNLKGAVALVIGSEGEGISKLTKDLCDEIVSLPLNGKVNSLNASVACGIALYEILAQNN